MKLVPYRLIRKETDSVIAHVLDNGDVEVHMPFAAVVKRFLPDIEKQIEMRRKTIVAKSSINYSFHPMLFGERYPIIKRAGDVCEFNGSDRCFYVMPGLRQYQLKNMLISLYTKIGKAVFSREMKEMAGTMGVMYDRFQISRATMPFGSCADRGQLIQLSWALAMTDEAFAKSVIIHELAHIKYDDHDSGEFIDFVREYDPSYDEVGSRKNDYEIMLRADGWIKFGDKR